MLFDSANRTIELLDVEVEVFLGAPAEPYMLRSHGPRPYKSLSDRIEDQAEEMFFKTERPIRVTHADTGETVATYNECGLVMSGEVVDV